MKTILTDFWQACPQGNWFKTYLLDKVLHQNVYINLFFNHASSLYETPYKNSQ